MSEPGNQHRRKLTEQEREEIRNQHQDWLRHIATAAIDGILVGLCVGLAVIFLDFNGIGTMLSRSDHQLGYTLLLLGGLAHTFGMVSAGMSVWLRATRDEG